MKIAFLGDSLTAGHPGASFLTRLRRLRPEHELLDYGRAGDTVPALLERLARTELAAVDLAFLWIGTNDAFFAGYDLPWLGEDEDPAPVLADGAGADRLRRDYDAVLDLALTRAPFVVCVQPVLPDPFEQGGLAERVAEIGAMIEAAASTRRGRTRVVDLRAAFAQASASAGAGFTIDGVHLNERGADVVAAAFAAVIAEALDTSP